MFGLRWGLDGFLGNTQPFALFYISLAAAAWFGGWGPGVLVALLGYALGDWFFLDERGTFVFEAAKREQVVQVFVYFLISGGILFIVGRLQFMVRARDESQARLEMALKSAGSGWWEVDPLLERSRMSSELARILGLEPSEQTRDLDLWKRRLHPADKPRVLDGLERALAGAGEYAPDYRVILPDGRIRWIASRAKVLRDRLRNPVRVVGVATDVTDLKEATEALRESEERFRTMADAAPVLIWMSDITRAHTYFSRGWLDFTGRTMDQELNDGWVEDVHPDDLDRCMKIYYGAFDRCEPFRMEYRLRHHRGEYRSMLDSGAPRFSGSGAFAGYVGACLDITDIVEAREVLARDRDELEQMVNARTEELRDTIAQLEAFSYSVSHDMRAPLRAMTGFSAALLEEYRDKLGPDGADMLE